MSQSTLRTAQSRPEMTDSSTRQHAISNGNCIHSSDSCCPQDGHWADRVCHEGDDDGEWSPLDLPGAQQQQSIQQQQLIKQQQQQHIQSSIESQLPENRIRQMHSSHVGHHQGCCSSQRMSASGSVSGSASASSLTPCPHSSSTTSPPPPHAQANLHPLPPHTFPTPHSSTASMAGTVRLDTDRTAPQHSEARRGSHGIASSLTLSTTPASHLRDGITATGEGGLERIVSPIRNVAPTQATPTYTSIPTFTTTRISASIASMQSGTAHATATRTTLTSTNTHRNDDMEVEEGVDGNSRIWDEMGEFQYESDDEMDEDYDNENVDSNSENSDGSDLSDDILEDEQQSGEKITEKQTALRKKIQLIQADSTVSGPEKAKRIQELMTKQWTAKQEIESSKDTRTINRLTDKKLDFSQISEEDKAVTYHTPSIMGCKHYQRCAKLQAHCCGKWDTCRFCHDEVSDHTIVRSLVVTMMCMFCNLVQPAGQDCVNPACGKRVARYYCKECKLWDDDPRKTIYHCHDCGICRIGKGLGIDYFHCPTCNVCMAIGLKGRHKCIERNLESDCPICGEYMFTSTSTVIFMPCGHCMHHKCHQQYTQTSYQCPTCLKSLADMTDYFRRVDESVALHQMPEEYNSTFSFIYCNDCEKKSYANYHFLYHKCGHCTGYNTKLLQTRIGLPPDAVIASKAIRVAASSLSSLEIAADTALASSTNSGLPNNSATVTRTSSSSAMPNSLATVTRISSASIDISDQHMASQIEELPEESTQATHDTTANVLQSLQSSSSGISSGSRSFWCHHCQLPSELYADGTIFRCTSCSSDFVEEI